MSLLPAAMRDQTEFLPLGPPIRKPAPISAAELRALDVERFESWDYGDLNVAPCFVHSSVAVDLGAASGSDCSAVVLRSGEIGEIDTKFTSVESGNSPALDEALAKAQQALMDHMFNPPVLLSGGKLAGNTATGLQLLRQSAQRQQNEFIRDVFGAMWEAPPTRNEVREHFKRAALGKLTEAETAAFEPRLLAYRRANESAKRPRF